jgi:hypothetical protein
MNIALTVPVTSTTSKTVEVEIAVWISILRAMHPTDRRDNRSLGRHCFIQAKAFDPNTSKLGKRRSIFGGESHLPISSEVLQVSMDCYLHLCKQAALGFPVPAEVANA